MAKIKVNIPSFKNFSYGDIGQDMALEFVPLMPCDNPAHATTCEVGTWDFPSHIEIETIEVDEDEFHSLEKQGKI